jgi:hypothetical protein
MDIVNGAQLITPSKSHACSFYILAFRWTFIHLTLRTTGTALAWKTLGVMLLATILCSKLWALKTEKITLTSHI